ncbi:hypothetical protein Ancab_029189 [Ancistrocladus abbreviatus]
MFFVFRVPLQVIHFSSSFSLCHDIMMLVRAVLRRNAGTLIHLWLGPGREENPNKKNILKNQLFSCIYWNEVDLTYISFERSSSFVHSHCPDSLSTWGVLFQSNFVGSGRAEGFVTPSSVVCFHSFP